MSVGIKRIAHPYDGVQFSHGDLLRSLHSSGHLLLMLQHKHKHQFIKTSLLYELSEHKTNQHYIR
jgi:hypothetical protein